MKTTLKAGVIQVRLSKPERDAVTKVHGLAALLSAMSPVDERLTKAAKAATEALRGVLDLTGEPEATE